jgi:hypothetical protein
MLVLAFILSGSYTLIALVLFGWAVIICVPIALLVWFVRVILRKKGRPG